MEGVDAVVHLVAVIRERGAYTFDAVNHLGTVNVVEAAREAGVRAFVHVGALGVSDNPEFPYLLSKWRGEQSVIGGGVPYTILRGSTLFGPGDGFVGTLAALVKAFPVVPVPGKGRTLYQPLHVEDMARCVAAALKLPELRGQILDLGGPHHLTHDTILDIIAGTYRLRRLKLHVPLTLMRGIVAIMERVSPHPPATLHQLGMLSVDSVTELDLVERTFGFQPRPLDGSIDYIRDVSYWDALKLSLGFPDRRRPQPDGPE
jgi:NADH dehydrogenase